MFLPRFSISRRLTVWFGLTLLVLLSLFAVFCYSYMHRTVHRDFDQHLAYEKKQIEPFVRLRAIPQVDMNAVHRTAAYETDGIYGTYLRLLDGHGNVVMQSPNFSGHDALNVLLPESRSEVYLSRDWEGKPARTVYSPLRASNGRLMGWLEITGFEWSLHQDLRKLAHALLIGVVLSILLALGSGFLLARNALKPVAALTDAARHIRATNLSERLPTQFGVRDELSDLAETFNDMIAKLEASFSRERRFSANAAHELLTPLTTMRNEIEVSLRRERQSSEYRTVLGALLEDINDMSATVNGLLKLAQTERTNDLSCTTVNLCAIVKDHVSRFSERARLSGLELSLDLCRAACVKGDAARLGEVVDNLIDNALKYGSSGSFVSVRVLVERGFATVVVMDDGVGFDQEQAPHLFDRFYRANTPEVQSRPGSGLGLAIVQSIAQAYGGEAKAQSPGINQGSTFEVTFPCAPEGSC